MRNHLADIVTFEIWPTFSGSVMAVASGGNVDQARLAMSLLCAEAARLMSVDYPFEMDADGCLSAAAYPIFPEDQEAVEATLRAAAHAVRSGR